MLTEEHYRSLEDKIELEKKYPLVESGRYIRTISPQSFGPFNDEKIGNYFVLHIPFDSTMPYVLTEEQYKSMQVTVTHYGGTYTYDTIYWRRC